MSKRDDELLELAVAHFGAIEIARRLKVSELQLLKWVAATEKMPELTRMQLVDLLRKESGSNLFK